MVFTTRLGMRNIYTAGRNRRADYTLLHLTSSVASPGMKIFSCSLTVKTTISEEINNHNDFKFA